MTIVVLGMLICLGAALVVLAAVALPRVRGGERWLTDDGQSAVRDARRRARAMAGEARERAGDVKGRASAAARDARQRAEEAVAVRRAARAEDDEDPGENPDGEPPAASAVQDAAPQDDVPDEAVLDDAEDDTTWQPAAGLRPATVQRDAVPSEPPTPAATVPAPATPVTAAAPPRAPVPEVVDLRDAEPVRPAAERREGTVERAIARSLEWGDPEPGPRHRR